MIKLIFTFVFGYLLCIISLDRVKVIERITAVKVKQGYYLKDNDRILVYKGSKYLVGVKETFDEGGNIIQAAIAGDVGYSIYTQREFNKYKNLINDYSLAKVINVDLVDSHRILVNNLKITATEIDKTRKMIYYNLKTKDTLCRIIYR